MNATTRFRTELLATLDPLFASRGFARRKVSFGWVRPVSAEHTHTVHLNFGLYPAEGRITVSPCIGVRFATLEAGLVAAGVVPGSASRDRSTVGFAMRPPNASSYAFGAADSPALAAGVLWTDLESRAFPQLAAAGTLDHVIATLQRPEPDQWGILSRSARARVWPLALQAAGRRDDALAVLAELEDEMREIDQLVPPFDQFAAWFRARAT